MFASSFRRSTFAPARYAPPSASQPDSVNPLWQRLASAPAAGSVGVHTGVQAKFSVSQVGDKSEQEADRVAEQVMRMPAGQCSAGAAAKTGCCSACDTGELQRAADTSHSGTAKAKEAGADHRSVAETGATSNGIHSLHGKGASLPVSTREFFETRFNHDFSDVRVHTGTRSTQLARSIQARAFTFGNDIVFGDNEYAPHSQQGQSLLAHELTHVIQQRGGAPDVVQRKPTPLVDETFLIKIPAGGMHLKSEPYARADNFPGDKVANNDVVVVRNTGGAATYRNVKNGSWSWIDVPGKSSPDANYPVLHGFIRNEHIAGMTIGPVESKAEPAAEEKEEKKEAAPAMPESCANVGVDDNVVRAFINDAISHAGVPGGGFDVEGAFRYLQSKRCLPAYCCNQDLAAAEHYMFSRYMVFVEATPGPVMVAAIMLYAAGKAVSLVPSLCDCPVTPTSWGQVSWALAGVADGEHDAFMAPP